MKVGVGSLRRARQTAASTTLEANTATGPMPGNRSSSRGVDCDVRGGEGAWAGLEHD